MIDISKSNPDECPRVLGGGSSGRLTVGVTTTTHIKVPKYYKYDPSKNITAYELALIIPVFSHNSGHDQSMIIEILPSNAKRHFVEMGNSYNKSIIENQDPNAKYHFEKVPL
jgi:hypothetical protein